MSEEPSTQLSINIPEPMQAGAYADAAVVWHTRDGFTIDFLAPVGPPAPAEGQDGQQVQTSTVVARVRLPVGVIFQVARAISENVAVYEQHHGAIGGPGGPSHPPGEEHVA